MGTLVVLEQELDLVEPDALCVALVPSATQADGEGLAKVDLVQLRMRVGREDDLAPMTAEHGAVGGEASGSRLAESRVQVMEMDVKGAAAEGARAAWRGEIEHAIDNVKRTKFDKWMRREWHKATARDRWSEGRRAKWVRWKEHHSPGVSQGAGHPSDRPRTTRSKVWVRGHVRRAFLDWVERHWSHGNETRAVLRGCCFEAWER